MQPEEVASHPEVFAAVAAAVERVNSQYSRAEGIKRWRILPREFTIEDGELTPTLKIRRGAVLEHNAAIVDELYAEE